MSLIGNRSSPQQQAYSRNYEKQEPIFSTKRKVGIVFYNALLIAVIVVAIIASHGALAIPPWSVSVLQGAGVLCGVALLTSIVATPIFYFKEKQRRVDNTFAEQNMNNPIENGDQEILNVTDELDALYEESKGNPRKGKNLEQNLQIETDDLERLLKELEDDNIEELPLPKYTSKDNITEQEIDSYEISEDDRSSNLD